MGVNKAKQYLHTLIQFCGRKKDKFKCALSLMLVVSLVLSLCINNAFVLAAQSGEQGEKHIHSFACRELICQEEHDDGEHTKGCFAAEGPWLCGMEEGDRHIHNQDGYNCWVMAKELNCDATKSNADRDSGQEEDDLLSSDSNATRSGARRAKSGRKHIHTDGCYGEVYECRPETGIALMSLGIDEEFVTVRTWDELREAIEAVNAAETKKPREIQLEEDISGNGQEPVHITAGTKIAIDLNGCALEYVSSKADLNLFWVESGGTLTITDTNTQETGDSLSYIDGDGNTAKILMSAGAVVGKGMDNVFRVDGTLNIENGRFTTVSSSRVLYVQGGTVNMSGGYIVNSKNAGTNKGGGAFINSGEFNMSSGYIVNNTVKKRGNAQQGGAGICAQNGGEVNISGTAVISRNLVDINPDTPTAQSINGGGIYVWGGATATISDSAVISGNTAENGGAIYGDSPCTVKITGEASIRKNNTINGSSKAIDVKGTLEIADTVVQDEENIGRALQEAIDNVQDGKLKLEKDYIVSSTVIINKSLDLDLDGHMIIFDGPVKIGEGTVAQEIPMIRVTEEGSNSGQLVIQDGAGSGVITSWAKGLNCLLQVDGGCRLELTEGTLDGSNSFNAVLATGANSIFTMSGGRIVNGSVLNATPRNGSGILVVDGAKLHMTGGIVSGCSAQNGGAVFVLRGGENETVIEGEAQIIDNLADVNGGGIRIKESKVAIQGNARISGNTAKGNGGAIYVEGGGTVNISGSADISGNEAKGNGGGIYVEANGTVNVGGNGAFIGNKATHGGAVFGVNGCSVELKDFAEILQNVSSEPAVNVTPKYGLGNDVLTQDSVNELSAMIASAENGGTINLDKSYAVLSSIPINKEITINLQGHTIMYGGLDKTQMFLVDGERSHLIITNAADSIKSDAVVQGAIVNEWGNLENLIRVQNKGKLTLENAILKNKNGNHAISASNSAIEINGGQIIGSGRKVQGLRGGGINLDGSALELSNGKIEGNKGELGGGIYAVKASKINVNNSEIIGNEAIDSGGGIYIQNSTMQLDGAAKLSNNRADIGGGLGVYDRSVVTITNAVISNNTARATTKRKDFKIGTITYDQNYGGGGIYVNEGGVVTLEENCIIEQNRSEATSKVGRGGGGNGGGGIFSRGMVVMKGGTIRDNYAKDSGGGIYAVGRFTMEGGTITGNTAQLDEGGGLRVDGKGSVITGGAITHNRTETGFDWGGGGVFINFGGELTIYNLLVNNNTAAGFGGGVGGCSSGDIEVCSLEGAAIYGNHANRASLTDREGYSKRDDQKISEYDVFKNSGCDDYFCAGTSTVYGRMLGDIDAGWVGSFGNAKRDASGGKVKEDGCTVYAETGSVNIPADGSKFADGWLALSAKIPDGSSEIRPSVIISDNYSNTHGGGIMSNGVLRLGSSDNFSGLRVSKRVNGSQADKEREYHFEVIFKNTSKQVDEYTYQKRDAEGTLRPADPSEVITDKLNQKVSFFLKHNESMEILGLLKGTEYTITETGADDYGTYIILGRGEAVKVVEDKEEKTISGSITSDTGTRVMFTNSKSSLVIEKENKEEGEGGKAFAFTVTLENENGIDGGYAYKKWTDGQQEVQEQPCTVSEGKLSLGGGTDGITLTHNEHIEIIGLPQGTRYTVEETGAADYITDVSVSEEKIYDLAAGTTDNLPNTKKITGTIEDGNSAVTLKFTNSKKPGEPVPKTGELRIAKRVSGARGDREKQFTFIINLRDEQGKPLTHSFQYRYDNDQTKTGTVSDGGVVKLSDGESVTIYGLLENTRYQVKEVEANADGYTTVITGAGTVSADGSGISGEITSGELKEVTFTNKASEDSPEPGPEPGPEPEYGTLTIKKRVTGEAEPSNKEFAFKVILMDQEGNALAGEYPYTGSEHDGVISGEDPDSWIISLKDGQQATITGLPVGTIYLAEELEESRDGYVVSPLEEEGSITESGRDPVVEFVNRKIQPSDPEHGTLTVTKAVTGTDERKAFTFTVRLRDGLGRPIPGEYRYDGARSGMISDGGKVMLGHGESITIYGLPANARYHVVEQEANKDSYVTTVTGDNGVIQPGGNSYIDFINHKEENPGNPDNPNPTDPDLPPSTPETPGNPGNSGGGGGGGGGRDRDNPTQPGTEGLSQTNPDVPTQPDGTPVLPEGSESQPGGPEPEGQAAPETETPIVTELPDPNDPASPDTVILMEDGVPRAYKKVWDPEKEEFVYMLDEDVPLAGRNMPKTGDPTRTNMWLILMILSLLGAGISWIGGRRRKDEDDRLL